MNERQLPANPAKPQPFPLRRVLGVILPVAVLIGVGLFLFFTFRIYKIPQKGMWPTFDPDEMVIARQRPYDRVSEVQRGDLVVFYRDVDGVRKDFIWRVIGLPGEEVSIVDDVVVIGEKRFQRNRLAKDGTFVTYSETFDGRTWKVALPEPATEPKKANMSPRRLGEGEFFLLGDNRHNAFDSRETGPVPFETIVGKVVYP
ncbi:MAG: signal peptidase I [Polyangiaceae bacterium]|nr:signal peptidase I [Polyangiaceae bacterium]